MQQSGSDAMGAETGGVPQTPPQGQPVNGVPPRPQAQASPGAVPPRPQAPPEMERGQAMVAAGQAANAADERRAQSKAEADQTRKDASAVNVYGKQKDIDVRVARQEREQIQTERKAEAEQLGLKGEQLIEFMANGKIATPKPTNMKEAWVKKPGEDMLTKVWVRPGSNERIYADTGDVVPEEVATVNPGQITAKERENYYGSYGNYYRAAKGRGLSDEASKEKAGEMVQKEFGVKLSRQEQTIAINAELSGIGGGSSGVSGGSAAPSTPKNGTVLKSGAPASPAGKVRKPGELPVLSTKDEGFVNMYLNSLFSNAASGRGGGGAMAVGINKGMNILAKASGLSPIEFQTEQAIKKDGINAIADTYKRYNAVSRVGDLLEGFGENVEDLGKKAIATGSPLLNKAWKSISINTVGNPDLRQYMLALNAMQRQYGVLTAGGALSNAMLPVSVGEKVEELMSPNQTLAEAIASVAQVKKETEIEKAGYLKSIRGAADDIRQGIPLGGGGSGGSGGTTHFVEGDDHWDIPADKLEAFKKAHPKAQAQ